MSFGHTPRTGPQAPPPTRPGKRAKRENGYDGRSLSLVRLAHEIGPVVMTVVAIPARIYKLPKYKPKVYCKYNE
jgi:hypothetical protein